MLTAPYIVKYNIFENKKKPAKIVVEDEKTNEQSKIVHCRINDLDQM